MAHGRGEAPRMEMKRKFDEEPRDCDRDKLNAGLPEAPVPSCSRVRHVLTDTTQPLETCKRARMEAARKDENFKWGNNETAENTQPVHREHDIPFNHGGGSKSPKEIHVPNIQASAGGASAGGATAGGATAGGVVDFGFQLQIDDKGSLSLNLTEEFVQGVFQGPETSIALKVESRESGGNGKCFLLTCDGIRDYV